MSDPVIKSRLNPYLQDKWSAVYSVQTILLSLQSLLGGTYHNGCLSKTVTS